MKSMTGYGKGEYRVDGCEMTVEMKAVNHRFLDIAFKAPKIFTAYEDEIKKLLQSKFSRGHIDVFVNYKSAGAGKITVNEQLVEEYNAIAYKLHKATGLPNDLTVTSLMRLDVVNIEDNADEETMRAIITGAVSIAADNLDKMRTDEGNALGKAIKEYIAEFEQLLNKVISRAPLVVEDYRTKLRSRITEVLAGVEIDQSRLLNEVAFFTDKANVDEEITRLKAHIVHIRDIMAEKNAVGKKLDFLVQEFNRECNTIGSKSNDSELQKTVIAMKNTVEKIREQIQNIE